MAEGINPEVRILYTNWRGETAVRRIIPSSIGTRWNKWHPESQWLLWAQDIEKSDEAKKPVFRDFAMSGILAWGDEAIAKRKEKMVEAYDAGFEASGEGWNAEYPEPEDRRERYEESRTVWIERFA